MFITCNVFLLRKYVNILTLADIFFRVSFCNPLCYNNIYSESKDDSRR